jgi:hypothetical protein
MATAASRVPLRRASIVATAIVALALLAPVPGVGAATTITVTNTAQLQNVLSSPTPCATGQAPFACPSAGDTISLAPGTYAPTVTLDPPISITLQGPSSAPGATLSGASVTAGSSGFDDLIDTDAGTSVTIVNLTLTGTKSSSSGPFGYAINATGTLTVQNSTLSGNAGVALWSSGPTATIVDSTISGNGGGGIMVDGTGTLQSVTIAQNTGTGIENANLTSVVHVTNTVVWGNEKDCAAPVDQSAASLDGDGTCGVQLTGNPNLGSLASNGGPTQTRALVPPSPAIDAGTTPCPSADQRYVPRDSRCDIGAYEWVDPTPPVITVPANIQVAATGPSGASVTYAVTFSDPDDGVASSGCTPASGSVFPIGTTTVQCAATDLHGNTATASFTVTVTSTGGISCRPDGKIGGRGSTLMAKAQTAFANGYRADVCGSVTDANGTTMSVYDYDATTGSDIGLQAASCRTDAFWGVDGPYTQSTLTALDASPGTLDCSPFAGLVAPYAPTPGPYPAPTDTAGQVMTIPVAGTSVAIGINLQAADCGGTKPSSIQLTTSMISRLLGGDIMRWNDAALRAGGLNAGLANCNRAVTRVVRLDSASTTQVLKNYLVHADNNRSTSTTCFLGGKWSVYANPSFNVNWPSDNGTFCSPVTTAATAGDTAQLATCVATPGALCYADLPVMVGQPTLIRPAIRNASDTAYAPPSSVSTANCSFSTLLPPSGGVAGAVGLNPGDTWATDNPTGSHGDVTFMGTGYPVCELTYVLAYAGLHAGGTAVSGLRFDQRQTLYSYLVYILSDPGQNKLLSSFFQEIPASIAGTLRAGVQGNL